MSRQTLTTHPLGLPFAFGSNGLPSSTKTEQKTNVAPPTHLGRLDRPIHGPEPSRFNGGSLFTIARHGPTIQSDSVSDGQAVAASASHPGDDWQRRVGLKGRVSRHWRDPSPNPHAPLQPKALSGITRSVNPHPVNGT